MADPLLVFGPRSTDYDFGPSHPLTPRRFGPAISLLEAIGARPGLAPEPASDDDLLLSHTARYIDVVRCFSEADHGWMEAEAGIGPAGDNPPFHGMHDAAAAVAGGSLRAVEAILRGEVEHAFHPGGGLHHAMPERASGFCIYDDPALAIARVRRDGLRVLYVDLDVHHGDGVEVIHAPDPGVLTVSIHESGRHLFPGSGFADELGEGVAAGTVVNVPLEPGTGEDAWLAAVESLLPDLAAAFGPDLIVSQHGADSHAWDPLAHLRTTTTAMGAAARLVDTLAHRHAGGRWLATGGGGYAAYAVVPRAWSLVWLAGAHRDVPDRLPAAWRERWAGEAARHGTADLPTAFTDPPNAGEPRSLTDHAADRQSRATVGAVRETLVPRFLRAAAEHGWTDVEARAGRDGPGAGGAVTPTVLVDVDAVAWERLTLAPRVIAPADPVHGHSLVAAALRGTGRATAALAGDRVVGLAVTARRRDDDGGGEELVALGVAPEHRRRGLATELLRAHLATPASGTVVTATFGVAERDVVEPLDHPVRIGIARRLLSSAGFALDRAPGVAGGLDPLAVEATRRA